MAERMDAPVATAVTGGVLTDVDASDLMRRMSAEERRTVDEAWRDPTGACADGILAAVARHRAAKQLRLWRWQIALGTFCALGSLLQVLDDPAPIRVVQVVIWGGLAVFAYRAVLRTRRSSRVLEGAADPTAAAARAVELRAADRRRAG